MSKLTKKAIKEAFVELLNERPLSEITVKDIAGKCELNRNTFYYHYANIPELIEDLIKEQIDSVAFEEVPYSSLEECIAKSIAFTLANKRAMYHIYKSVSRDIFERYLREMCEYAISSYFEPVFEETPIRKADRDLIVHYYECFCFGAIIMWLEDGMDRDIIEEFHRIFELNKGHMEEMVKRSIGEGYWSL